MSNYKLYSKTLKEGNPEPEVYSYDSLPRELRVQTAFIWDKLFTGYGSDDIKQRFFNILRDVICEEYGKTELTPIRMRTEGYKKIDLMDYFLEIANPLAALDIIQVSFQILRDSPSSSGDSRSTWHRRIVESITRLNQRFREHAIGYELTNFQLVRVDSQFLHTTVVKPSLILLQSPGYEGAEQEFYEAHEHYRLGRLEDAMVSALKSMESTLKCIFDEKGWSYTSTDPFKGLLEVALENQLFPKYWENHFNALKACLIGGAPTARNKVAGHGQGPEIRDVPEHIAAFTLHSAGAAIVLFVESAKLQ
jgi:hypothetical protein